MPSAELRITRWAGSKQVLRALVGTQPHMCLHLPLTTTTSAPAPLRRRNQRSSIQAGDCLRRGQGGRQPRRGPPGAGRQRPLHLHHPGGRWIGHRCARAAADRGTCWACRCSRHVVFSPSVFHSGCPLMLPSFTPSAWSGSPGVDTSETRIPTALRFITWVAMPGTSLPFLPAGVGPAGHAPCCLQPGCSWTLVTSPPSARWR